MITLKKYNLSGAVVGELPIQESLVQTSANPQMIKDYIVAIRNNARQWSANTKTRAEVCHSGQKPHPQKGTGRARQGYLGAPQYKGGGRVHSPRPKFDQHVRVNKKERRAANRYLLSEKIANGNVHVLSFDGLEKPRTKTIQQFLKALNLKGNRILFLAEGVIQASEAPQEAGKHSALKLSIRNLPRVEISPFANINGYELLVAHEIIILDGAVDEMMVLLGGES